MKIEITCEDLSKGRSYPYIGLNKFKKYSILFLSDSSGFVVGESLVPDYTPGFHSNSWNEESFTPIAYPPFDLSFTE